MRPIDWKAVASGRNAGLASEMECFVANVRQRHLDDLQAAGVSARAIAALGQEIPPFGVHGVADIGSGYFAPFAAGPIAVITPVFERGALIDLVAWSLSRPDGWLWRNGQGAALGADLLARSQWSDRHAVKVVATPLDWLRHAGQALCILDWDALDDDLCAVRYAARLAFADELLASRLVAAIERRRVIPEILICGDEVNAS
jgi:hypothetical protein